MTMYIHYNVCFSTSKIYNWDIDGKMSFYTLHCDGNGNNTIVMYANYLESSCDRQDKWSCINSIIDGTCWLVCIKWANRLNNLTKSIRCIMHAKMYSVLYLHIWYWRKIISVNGIFFPLYDCILYAIKTSICYTVKQKNVTSLRDSLIVILQMKLFSSNITLNKKQLPIVETSCGSWWRLCFRKMIIECISPFIFFIHLHFLFLSLYPLWLLFNLRLSRFIYILSLSLITLLSDHFTSLCTFSIHLHLSMLFLSLLIKFPFIIMRSFTLISFPLYILSHLHSLSPSLITLLSDHFPSLFMFRFVPFLFIYIYPCCFFLHIYSYYVSHLTIFHVAFIYITVSVSPFQD